MWPFLENYMKIRVLTQKETGDIKAMLKERVVVAREIHELLKLRIEEGYERYVSEFKWSLWNPFTFKPVSYEKMLGGLLGKYSTGFGTAKNPKTIQFTDNKTFEYVDYTGYDCNFHFDNTIDTALLTLADYAKRYVISHKKNRDYANLLMQYAIQPFELTQEDILAIEDLEDDLTTMRPNLEKIKNDIANSK